jgi:hypothetical protein
MRTSGFCGDFGGEPKCLNLAMAQAGAGAVLLTWQGGATMCGWPLGLPCGDDNAIGFQVYRDRSLVGWTVGNELVVPFEYGRRNWFEVVPIASHLGNADQSHITASDDGDAVTLSWPATTSADALEYRVYTNNGTSAGSVVYTSLYATVYAKTGGQAASSYTLRVGGLASGQWKFGVRAVDAAGNMQTTPTREASCAITRVPGSPQTLALAYTFVSKKATLTWTAPAYWS